MRCQTVTRTIIMWIWLARHPECNKADFMRMAKPHGWDEPVINNCYLCGEYLLLGIEPQPCLGCPLCYDDMNCDDNAHPYSIWGTVGLQLSRGKITQDVAFAVRTEMAYEIVRRCRKWEDMIQLNHKEVYDDIRAMG